MLNRRDMKWVNTQTEHAKQSCSHRQLSQLCIVVERIFERVILLDTGKYEWAVS